MKKVEAKCGVQREAEALKQLFLVCNALQRCFPPAFTVRDWKRIAATHNGEEAPWSVASSAMRAKEVLQKECGVSLSLRQSEVGGAGVGVFTDADVGEGKLVGLYPGNDELIVITDDYVYAILLCHTPLFCGEKPWYSLTFTTGKGSGAKVIPYLTHDSCMIFVE